MSENLWLIDIDQISFFHPTLVEVLHCRRAIMGPGVIKGLYFDSPSKIHLTIPLRAIDEECHDPTVGIAIEEFINASWIYDPDRPKYRVCLYHNVGQGPHLHYQVHPNTIRR